MQRFELGELARLRVSPIDKFKKYGGEIVEIIGDLQDRMAAKHLKDGTISASVVHAYRVKVLADDVIFVVEPRYLRKLGDDKTDWSSLTDIWQPNKVKEDA